ncbi:EGF-like domain-containing protein [Tieghemostelium lacteum]|uniref:EGF-like domain-containing protein n=1 Tax=Tieghemostelium lacteum TaxID=361077 RepID=A0A151ZCX2_TIELA|nr:EGF-like domain-containing protein [Tieghemostelium lacteum]|eukprot:KYQ91781.1 EGF-like domain-containing protein [Tieghemostelium lacteum]
MKNYSLFTFFFIFFILFGNLNGQCPLPYQVTNRGCLLGGTSDVIETVRCVNGNNFYNEFTSVVGGNPCTNGYTRDNTYSFGYTIPPNRYFQMTVCQTLVPSMRYAVPLFINGEICTENGGDDYLFDFNSAQYRSKRYLTMETCIDGYIMFDGSETSTTATQCGPSGGSLHMASYDMGLLYTCSGVCANGGTCNQPTGQCQCTPAWTGALCQNDADECTLNIDNCAQNCINTNGGFKCSCNTGYTLNANKFSCDDINECLLDTDGCQHGCINNVPGFTCTCNPGYRLNTLNTKTCDDIDECLENTDGCAQNCTNSVGSFTCSCGNGYTLNTNQKTCDDVDECLLNTDGCQQGCLNIGGGFTCTCNTGFSLNADKKTCGDINECTLNTDGCAQNCTNTVGGFQCSCMSGYVLNSNGKSCDNVNECAMDTDLCTTSTTCVDTVGSYRCDCVNPTYGHSSPYECIPVPQVTSVTQIAKLDFQISGSNFGTTASLLQIKIGQVNCQSISFVNPTTLKCSIPIGSEAFGVVSVKLSGVEGTGNYIGSPYIESSSNRVVNTDILVTIMGKRLPNTLVGTKMFIGSQECTLTSATNIRHECTIGRGTGHKLVKLTNGAFENTDNHQFAYPLPEIHDITNITSEGGSLTVTGQHIGTDPSKISMQIGTIKCNNIEILTGHEEFKCNVVSGIQEITHSVELTVDGQTTDSTIPVYITVKPPTNPKPPQCGTSCPVNGVCTSDGCKCKEGYTGTNCDKVPTHVDPKPDPEKPGVDVGTDPKDRYKISIVRVQELNYQDTPVVSIDLLNSQWKLASNQSTNTWTYTTTLSNNASISTTFEYITQADGKSFNFSGRSIHLSKDSMKLSIAVNNWDFDSRLNRLEFHIENSSPQLMTDKCDNPVNQSSVSQSTNQNTIFTELKNPSNGMYARFMSYAEIDGHAINGRVRTIPNEDTTKTNTVIVATSVPYFKTSAVIDPDYSVFLRVASDSSEDENNIECSSNSKKTNWRLIVGVTVGGVAGIALIVGAILLIKKKIVVRNFMKKLNNKVNKA